MKGSIGAESAGIAAGAVARQQALQRPPLGDAASRAGRPSLLLVTESPAPSGMGRQILTLARGLSAWYRVVVAAPIAREARWVLARARDQGIETWPLPDGDATAVGEAVRRRLLEDNIDLVNVHAGIGWEGHAIVRASRQAGVSSLVRTEHLPFLLADRSQKAVYMSSLREADRVIAVSAGVAASHVAAGVDPARIRIVRNGISDPLSGTAPSLGSAREAARDGIARSVRRRFGIPDAAPLLVAVGRLAPQKGLDVLIRAAAAVARRRADVRFLIVGSGPLAASLDAAIAELDLTTVVHRLAEISDVPGLLANATAAVLPSRFEGLPLVALEAMAVGRPVVGTRVCGLEETVDHGVTGLLVSPDDPDALADAVLAVVEDDAAAAAYGRAGRARFESEFTATRMVAETAVVFEDVLGAKAALRVPLRVDDARAPTASAP